MIKRAASTRTNRRSRRKRHVQFLLSLLFVCNIADAGVWIEVTTVPSLPVGPEIAAILHDIQSEPLTAAGSPWERDLLDATRRSFRSILTTPLGPLAGMSTKNTPASDVLIGHWWVDEPATAGVRALWAWDTAQHSWFVLECDPSTFASRDATERFLSMILKPDLAPAPLHVAARYAPPESQGILIGTAPLPQPIWGETYSLFAVRQKSAAYLLIQVGKACLASHYPKGGIYVPERFPPLNLVAATWSKMQIFAEIGKTWPARGPMAYHNDRDAILIMEAAHRGLDKADLEALLLPLNAPDIGAMERRAIVVMQALHQLERNPEAFEDVVLRLGRTRELGSFALQAVFLALEGLPDSDYTKLASECLKSCLAVEPPLRYLANAPMMTWHSRRSGEPSCRKSPKTCGGKCCSRFAHASTKPKRHAERCRPHEHYVSRIPFNPELAVQSETLTVIGRGEMMRGIRIMPRRRNLWVTDALQRVSKARLAQPANRMWG